MTTTQTAGQGAAERYSAQQLMELLHEGPQESFTPPTEEQAPVIEHALEPMLVVAGAGSGKTATMADRVVYQVATGAVQPDEVLGVTFTKKAAGELRERIVGKLTRLSGIVARAERPPVGPGRGEADDAAPGLAGGGHGLMDLLAPEVSTYHSYAHSLVREYGLQIGLEPETRVITEAEAWQIVSQVVAEYAAEHQEILIDQEVKTRTLADHALKLAGECAEHLIDDLGEIRSFLDAEIARPEGLPLDEPGVSRPKSSFTNDERGVLRNMAVRRHVVDVVAAYQERKRTLQVMDYGDLLVNAVRIVRETDAAQKERQKYRLVLLDEFQDTSHAQLELFTALFADAEGPGVTAVGDPNQSIYGFRGASAGQLFSFIDRFTRADPESGERFAPRKLQLTKAWRNGTTILQVANRSVAPLRERQDVTAPAWKRHRQEEKRISALTAGKTHPGEVRAGWFTSDEEESEAVAERLATELGVGAGGPGRAPDAAAPPTAAVLSRTRKHLVGVARALEARGVPYEFLGLSGLLEVPEVADVVAYLRVLADASRSDALLRLLAGPKYQIPPRDLVQLNRLARRTMPESGASLQEASELASLVEGLFAVPRDPREPRAQVFSPGGHQRLLRAKQDLRVLARGAFGDVPALIERVIEVSGLGVEVSVRAGQARHGGRRQLDALLDHARGYASAANGGDLEGFLDWLDAAQEREQGLGQAAAEPRAGAVQLLTVHASKGLEWEVVAVVGLREGVFPSAKSDRWTGKNGSLPWPLRGDAESLPQWDTEQTSVMGWSAALGTASPKQTDRWRDQVRDIRGFTEDAPVLTFAEEVAMFRREEERRLAYVAFTRAERLLLASGSRFVGATRTGEIPSQFLRELAEVDAVQPWVVVDPQTGEPVARSLPEEVASSGIETSEDEELQAAAKDYRKEANPKAAELWGGAWPFDPLAEAPLRRYVEEAYEGEPWRAPARRAVEAEPQVKTRRPAVEAAAARVQELIDQGHHGGGSDLERQAQWAVDRFLAARQPLGAPKLPATMSTSRFVELDADGEAVAERYRRPVPKQPLKVLRRGTAVHSFIEDFYGQQASLEGVEDPMQGDKHLSREFGVEQVRASLEASPWGARQIAAMEIGIMTAVDGVTVTGRIDAVFGTEADGTDVSVDDFDRWQRLPRPERNRAMGECMWQLVDWKTGKVPYELENRQLQLAIYRLAFSRSFGVPLEQISAAFYYVDHARTIEAENLPGAEQLEAVIREARRFFG